MKATKRKLQTKQASKSRKMIEGVKRAKPLPIKSKGPLVPVNYNPKKDLATQIKEAAERRIAEKKAKKKANKMFASGEGLTQVGRAQQRKLEKQKAKETKKAMIAEVKAKKKAEKEALQAQKKAEREAKKAKSIKIKYEFRKGKNGSLVYDAPIPTVKSELTALNDEIQAFMTSKGFESKIQVNGQIILTATNTREKNWLGMFIYGYLRGTKFYS